MTKQEQIALINEKLLDPLLTDGEREALNTVLQLLSR